MKKAKRILASVFAVCCFSMSATSQTRSNENYVMEKMVILVREDLDRKLLTVTQQHKQDMEMLTQRNEALNKSLDSIKNVCGQLQETQTKDRTTISDKIRKTDNAVASNQSTVERRTVWGRVIFITILLFLFVVFLYLTKRIKKGDSSIDEVRRAQKALQSAQAKMQEDSIKLDSQMLTLVQQQIANVPTTTNNNETDHSLALKVADEIVRIELNLSRMDASVKGYKQLSKAVERIKNNFMANGYEIIDMLGKPYNEGMKVVANFVPDDTLNEGEQIITGVTKPQINYNGRMIQSAQITVSQNI